MSNETELKRLQDRLNQIQQKQDTLQSEIILLKTEIRNILNKPVETNLPNPITDPVIEIKPEPVPIVTQEQTTLAQNPAPPYIPPPYVKKQSDIEKFIGENLISKIGILVLIIGVGIGVKYAIDNDLASPMVRIIFGYLCSIGLLGTAVYLKKKYENFSAVLFSGGVATAYFTTYFAAAFYTFLPKEAAFPLMVLLTIGTIASAIWYNKEVIAHIGLWGAYAVPVLLSSGSNKVEWLYSYMLIINVGIMILSFKRDWKLIFLNAFFSSWAIFIFSSSIDFHTGQMALTELLFASAFFLLFYVSILFHKLIKNTNDGGLMNAILVINAFIYAAIGSLLVYNINESSKYSALFLFINGALYSITAVIALKKYPTLELFKIISPIAVLFFVISIPVQFSGMLIPLMWTILALTLVLLKKTLKSEYLGWLGSPLFLLVLAGCIIGFCKEIYDIDLTWKAFVHIDFLWSVLIIVLIGITYKILPQKTSENETQNSFTDLLRNACAILIGLLIYLLFLTEIICVFRADYLASVTKYPSDIYPDEFYTAKNEVVATSGVIYSIIYTLCFSAILGLMNIFYFKHKILATVHQIINGGLTFIFISLGLILLFSLDKNYNAPPYPNIYPAQTAWITLRYFAFASFIFMIVSEWLYVKKGFLDKGFNIFLAILFHFSVVLIISHEIIHWSEIRHIEKLDKYGISIFWGIYALFLVGYGIWKNKKFLRIEGIVLTGITLVKLFFYDTSNLGTIPKTILFISVGLLLLVISFLYNKYKDLIIDKDSEEVSS